MNIKIKSIVLAVALVALCTQSCSDFLEEKLISDVSAGSYYTTAAGLEDAVDASYSFLREIHSNERAYMLTIFGTDTHTNGADGGWKSFNYYDNNLNSQAGILREQWTFLYRGINQANAVLNRSEKVTDMTDALKAIRQAEARFLRAYYYFYLVQTWGNVHFTLEETIGAEVTANKTDQSTIYAEGIIPDLEFAVANLPATQSNYGRATKAAAQFLLGKVYLTRAYQSFGSSADYTTAETYFSNVINDYGFALVASHKDLWDQDKQINKEVIWAVQYSTDLILNGGNGGVGNRGHLYFLMEYDIRPGMIRDIANGRPFKRFRPTDHLISLWEATRDIDQRYEDTYKHAYISNNPNSIPKWEQIHVDNSAKKADGSIVMAADIGKPRWAVGDTAMYVPGPGKDGPYMGTGKYKVRYNVITQTPAFTGDQYYYTERLFPTVSKFIDPRRPTIQWERGSRDWFLFRLADAYLLRAEARLGKGDNPGSRADILEVRNRAAKPGVVMSDPANTPATITLDYLLEERAREMDAEQCRWFDLARTGKLIEYASNYNPQTHAGGTFGGAVNIQSYHIHRPIPQDQIDKTLGGYLQNCGYDPSVSCN